MSGRRTTRSGRRKRSRPGDDEPSSSAGDMPSSDPAPSMDEGEGDDLLDADVMRADYRAMPALDKYERSGLDTRRYARMDADERKAAEASMMERERMRKRGRTSGAGVALLADDDEEEDKGAEELRARMRDRREDAAMGDVGDETEELAAAVALAQDAPLREWAETDAGQRFVQHAFSTLLNATVDKMGKSVYEKKIHDMCAANGQSLEVSWLDLAKHQENLALLLADAPKAVLRVMNDQAKIAVEGLYTDYAHIHDEIHVRIVDIPLIESLRELRQAHLNTLVQVTGVVTRRSVVFPQLKMVRFTCQNCKHLTPAMYTHDGKDIKLGLCPECQSAGPFTLASEHSVYRNYQTMTLQETPGSVPAGRVPRYKEVILLADLVDKARPGDQVNVIGVYTNRFELSLNTRQGFPVFSTVLEANNVIRREVATTAKELTEEDKRELQALAADPRIVQRIIKSIAPSVYGQDHMKTAMAMSMFGGAARVKDGHRVRGDINVLLLGDPGTAKSQCLKYVEKTAPRAVFTTGKGASAVGLTAAVHKDPMTGEYTLEGGALVLADQGTCLIDEFDKMNDQDRTSIHEAMEQQSISISKAGIVTSLQARCAVIAAANPIGGRYDPTKSFSENVLLTDPILQRFDILCVLQDTVDPVNDERLAKFVLDSHSRSHPARRFDDEAKGDDEEKDPDIIPQELLKKYIHHARSHTPEFTNFHTRKMAELYAHLRQSSERHTGIPVAVRHIESMMRMAQAHARMRLRDHVEDVDADAAMKVMLESFVQSQKFASKRALRKEFARYITLDADTFPLLMDILSQMVKEKMQIKRLHARGLTLDLGSDGSPEEEDDGALFKDLTVDKAVLQSRARDVGITSVDAFLKSKPFRENGFKLVRGKILKAFDVAA